MTKMAYPPLQTVPHVDIRRYLGTWLEVAHLPNRFQQWCVNSKATYTLRDDGNIDVVNECFDKDQSGKLRQARGKAWVADPLTNAKLKVSFFWPFSGDYWIIDLGQDYEYAVIGHPKRTYLWILSRTETMDSSLYQAILGRLQDQHYDTSQLITSN